MLNAVTPSERRAPQNSWGFMQINSIEQALICAELIAKSSFCPKSMVGKPGDIVIALQFGQEIGLKPMQALQNIAVINGRPCVWGDAALALCMQSPNFEYIKEEYIEATKTAVCRAKRRNMPEVVKTFSQEQAARAKLWGKPGPWSDYPEVMLANRARGFCLRVAFADVLKGLYTSEEAQDMPTARIDYSYMSENAINGQVVSDSVITQDQLGILEKLIAESETKEIDICQHLKIESLESMPMDKWEGVCMLLEKKIAKKKKVDSLAINQVFQQTESPIHIEELLKQG